ncbi:hypothetical protein TIFTF001_035697 [Ficus carica]|uniref:Uncharacterized protein n=1 Tax=Ficus carica TaxID=3494 RepID=A0AA88J6S6_FICCA|nr:hypothetical protein TIFTF001_035697 [Ficus carica]
MSFNEQEGTYSCTLRRSSITQDIPREVSTTTAYSIGFVVYDKLRYVYDECYDYMKHMASKSPVLYRPALGRVGLWFELEMVWPPQPLHSRAPGKQPSAMVDTRWKGMAGQTAGRYRYSVPRVLGFDREGLKICSAEGFSRTRQAEKATRKFDQSWKVYRYTVPGVYWSERVGHQQ